MPAPDLVALWEAHCRHEFETRDVDATMATMVARPYVNHVPTMTGGVGHDQLKRFYKYHFIGGNPPDTELKPISRTVGADQIVDELIFCFTHTSEIDWMLPGIAPTGKRVEVPLVAIVRFEGDKVAHEHIYWDQASVLVQVGLLDPKGLPVAGIETARKVADNALPSNGLMTRWARAPASRSERGSHALDPPHPLRQPPRRLRRPLSRRRRGLRDPRSRRQRHRCRLCGGHRARRAASRRGERGRRGADHDPHGQGKVVTIAGLGHWPKRFPADLFMREHGGKMPLGILRTVVPAAPDAWITALTDYGTMSFGDVAGAAVRYAREGFAVFEYMATMIKQYEDGYRSWPSNAAIFLPGGKLPQVGDRFVQTDLAGTLQYMIDQERAASQARPAGRPRRSARRLLLRRHRRDDRALSRGERRLSRARRPRELPQPLRGAGAACAGATSRSSPAGRGARARCWPRRCA